VNEPQQADLVVTGAAVLTCAPVHALIEDGAVAVRGSDVVAVGPRADVERRFIPARRIDATDQVVLPGLINCHTHVIQILLRGGLGADHSRNLYDWLVNLLYPGLAQYAREDASVATRLYCLEAIRGGITTIVENADWGHDRDCAEATIDALDEMGVRGIYARLFYDLMPDDFARELDALAGGSTHIGALESTDAALEDIRELWREHDQGTGGRLRIWAAPAIPQTTTEEGLLGALEFAQGTDGLVGLHVAQAEVDQRIGGRSAIEYLDAVGVLNERLQAAHCVWVSDSDIRLMSERGVRVAHNPTSNLYLGAGIAPVSRFRRSDVLVGLGTDDANGNDSVNLFQEMKLSVLLQRGITNDALAMTAKDALSMATLDAARSIGLEGLIGSIEEGKRADLITVDPMTPQLTPMHDVIHTLVFQGTPSAVRTTVVDGEVLMEDGRLTGMSRQDETDVLEEARRRSEGIAKRAGLLR
jgi:cytosine/adenosine deaminase-related metal-dependent hydrolase